MAKFWKDIFVPLAVAGAVAAQTIGIDAGRASRLSPYFPVKADTLETSLPDTAKASLPDSLKRDSLFRADTTSTFDEEEDFFSFEEDVPDTVPRIFARDTMKVPDSLRLTNPFLYKYYVAVRDSFTHRLVVDSLKASGDSLDWPLVDSIYLADSTAAARERFEKWYASLSKIERKRYDYEQKLPEILRKQDSIFKRKDSIQRRKDSIIQYTPRILETAFLPDTLLYKRLVSWRHERLFNRIETFEWDTTANYHFYDYPFMREDVGASWLGMPGSAVQQYNFFRRKGQGESTSFYEPYESWTYTPSSLPMFNTKTPYTELEYSGNLFNSSTLSADNFRVFTTQNILPSLNIALEMKRYGGAGTLKNEENDNRTYFVTGNWIGKKYLAHGGFIYNKISREESGGIQDNMWIRDTTVDVREIEVNLAAATNRYVKKTLFFDQSYRMPFTFIETLRHRGDSTWTRDSLDESKVPTGFIGSSSELSEYTKKYVDNTSTALDKFYNGIFNTNPSKSSDSMRVMRFDNRVFARLQPWSEDAVISKVEAGIGDRFQSFWLFEPKAYISKPVNTVWNSAYVYAGAEGRLWNFSWDATALANFAGTESGDFNLDANASLVLHPFRRTPKSPVTIKAHIGTELREPSFYEQNFYSNHYSWSNSFDKISTSRVQGSLDIPKWGLKASLGYALLSNNIYYDNLGIASQNRDPMSVASLALRKDLRLGKFHFENSALLQYSSKQEVVPLPTLALNLRWYLQLYVVSRDVMTLQAGVNTRYTTLWYAPGFNPVAGVFMNQQEELYGNCPVFDVFLNVQWKKCCIFLKLENAGKGWPLDKHDYFTAHHFIQAPSSLKFGISWPFYPRLGNTRTLSSRAGSSMGMGMGGLGNGLGSFTNGL